MSLDSIFKLSVIVNMIDNLTSPMARINSTVEGSVGRIQKLEQGFGNMTKTGISMASVGAGITSAVLSPVEATFETRKALGELSSLGIKDLKTLENAAKDFSSTWAGTTKAEFISAAYDIKSGIASLNDEGVAGYTNLSGITAKATKSSIGEMTSLFATGYGIYKDFYKDMSDLEFGEMFSAGISKSVQAFKTTGSGMAQSIQTLGAAATTSNVPLEEQLSILGMLQATMSGSEAGTKYKAFLNAAANAGEDLGLSFTDANNQLLSMPEILAMLQGKFGDTMDAAEKMQLKKAFGTDEAVALIDLLYSKTDDLQGNILSMYNSMGQGTEVATNMANAINQTEGEKYVVLQQKLKNVKEEIGNQLLPTVNQFLNKGNEVLESVSNWIGKNQGLVKAISLIVLTLGIALTVFGTTTAIVGGLGLMFTRTAKFASGFWGALKNIPGMLETVQIRAMYAGDALKKGFTNVKSYASTAVSGIKSVATSVVNMGKTMVVNGATALKNMAVGLIGMGKQAVITAVQAMPGLIASVWSFTAALLANPITWVIVGIVALIAAIILLWKNWDQVTAWVSNAMQAVFNKISAIISGIKEKFISIGTSIFGFFSGIGSRIKESISGAIDGAKTAITEKLQVFKESGKKIMSTFAEGIKSVAMAPVNAVKGGLQKIRQMLPFSDAKEGPLSTLTLSGRRVFETITTGMMQTKDMPAETTEKAFSEMDMRTRGEVKKINLKEVFKSKEESSNTSTEKEGGIKIEQLNMSVDISKIKDLQTLFKLIKEIEDLNNGNPEPTPA